MWSAQPYLVGLSTCKRPIMLQVKTIQAPTDRNSGVSHFATRLLPLAEPWTHVAASLSIVNIYIYHVYIYIYIPVLSWLHGAACR